MSLEGQPLSNQQRAPLKGFTHPPPPLKGFRHPLPPLKGFRQPPPLTCSSLLKLRLPDCVQGLPAICGQEWRDGMGCAWNADGMEDLLFVSKGRRLSAVRNKGMAAVRDEKWILAKGCQSSADRKGAMDKEVLQHREQATGRHAGIVTLPTTINNCQVQERAWATHKAQNDAPSPNCRCDHDLLAWLRKHCGEEPGKGSTAGSRQQHTWVSLFVTAMQDTTLCKCCIIMSFNSAEVGGAISSLLNSLMGQNLEGLGEQEHSRQTERVVCQEK
eukprot:1157320-Pelagomonas_calceolata.AAC.3